MSDKKSVIFNFKMKVFVIAILLFSNEISGKKSHQSSSSDEGSIENILYYKDRKARVVPTPVLRKEKIVPSPPQPVCPCPKMCCTICCECSDSNSMFGRIQAQMPSQGLRQMQTIAGSSMNGIGPMMGQQMGPQAQQMGPQGQQMNHKMHQLGPPMGRKKFPQMPSRRTNTITRQNIKSLIAKDDDIKNILKDLVRVTIQKVDLQAMLEAKKSGNTNFTNGIFDAQLLRNAVTEAIKNYKKDMEIYDDDPGGMDME